jgi:hypothetical protein
MPSLQSFICVMVKLLSTADPEVPFGIAALDCKMDHGTVRPPAKPVLNPQYEWLAIFTTKPDFAKGWSLYKSTNICRNCARYPFIFGICS